VAGILLEPAGELLRRAAVGQGTAGVQIGEQHLLVGVQDLGRLGHEVNAAEDDHLGLGGGRLLRELQRVAHEIRDVLDLRVLVVVGEDHRVQLLAQALDPAQERLALRHGPFRRGRLAGERQRHGAPLDARLPLEF